ncbi:hypothetical protein [Leminorella grimontii]|uniref:hypothetical protein n=1 Tax=Leminorella grimontii TaxID=82981 RepID=UPI00207E832B|nr:hypothetical protein [Leminorella grimontii]GKX59042.1 hypothetical protein SOASR031_13570 [Leminorella grimontii]
MLDISYLSDSNGSKPSFTIHDSDMKLFVSAFEALRQKTGVHIDPYGKARIYSEHQKVLIYYLLQSQDVKVIEFIIFLEMAIKDDEVLIADGD